MSSCGREGKKEYLKYENIFLWRRRKTVKEYFLWRRRKTEKKNIWRIKIYLFGEEKEKEENILRRKISFFQQKEKKEKKNVENIWLMEEKKKEMEKEGKFSQKETIFFSGGEEKQRSKKRTIFGEGKYLEKENIFKEVTNSREGKGGIIWRGKINVDANRPTDIGPKPTDPMCTQLVSWAIFDLSLVLHQCAW